MLLLTLLPSRFQLVIFRSLDAACDAALDTADSPLDLWQRVEAEVRH